MIYGDRVLHVERGALSNLWEEIWERCQLTRPKDKTVCIILWQRNRAGFSVPRIDGLTSSNGKLVHEPGHAEGVYISAIAG